MEGCTDEENALLHADGSFNVLLLPQFVCILYFVSVFALCLSVQFHTCILLTLSRPAFT